MNTIKITDDMVIDTHVEDGDWEMVVLYKGKKYFLHIVDFTMRGPVWKDWERKLYVRYKYLNEVVNNG